MTYDIFLTNRFFRFMSITGIVSTFCVALVFAAPAFAQNQNGCQTGAEALAHAFVRSDPMNALFVGSLESYVAANQSHFTANGDAIRCARAMVPALLNNAVQLYDPNAHIRQQELNARIGLMGINPGPGQATPAMMFLEMVNGCPGSLTYCPQRQEKLHPFADHSSDGNTENASPTHAYIADGAAGARHARAYQATCPRADNDKLPASAIHSGGPLTIRRQRIGLQGGACRQPLLFLMWPTINLVPSY